MSYQVWSVVFGEQPSASKWNILGTNDAGFNDGTAIGDDAILSRHIADAQVLPAHLSNAARTWEELARTTLGSAGDTISCTPIAAKKYLMVIFNAIASGGTIDSTLRFNNDSGANYAQKHAVDFSGTASDSVSATGFALETSSTISGGSTQTVCFIYNPSTGDKLIQWRNSHQVGGLTAATVPRTLEGAGSWNNNAQVTRIDWINAGTGDFPIGSEMIVMGMD
jgi:hypothetical protein